MRRFCTKPIEGERHRNDVSINQIIEEMLGPHKKIIHDHIQKFLDTGDQLKTLTVSHHADGTLILRSDERTVVTVRISVEGRNLGGAEFNVVQDL